MRETDQNIGGIVMSKTTRFLSVKETARRLNMSPQGLQLLAAKGLLPCAHNRAGEQIFDTATIKQYQQRQYQFMTDHYYNTRTAR
jgi:hypothetical protein